MNWQLKTSVAFLIFNRPETTARVFEIIRKARPPQLLVVADGPRPDRPGESERCAAARAIIDGVDWPCEVFTNFSSVNLGCRNRISSGLSWVFDTVEEAIILEDDCLPHPDFFRYCEELLEKYRTDERIMMISGDNFQNGRKRTQCSYYFSLYSHVWGWASWRRAWKHYDVSMKQWPQIREEGWLKDVLGDLHLVTYWTHIFDEVYSGRINTWDYQLNFAAWMQGKLTLIPNNNLVSNIGYGGEATHTAGSSKYSNMNVETPGFPLIHPSWIIRDIRADAYTARNMFTAASLPVRALKTMKRIFS